MKRLFFLITALLLAAGALLAIGGGVSEVVSSFRGPEHSFDLGGILGGLISASMLGWLALKSLQVSRGENPKAPGEKDDERSPQTSVWTVLAAIAGVFILGYIGVQILSKNVNEQRRKCISAGGHLEVVSVQHLPGGARVPIHKCLFK